MKRRIFLYNTVAVLTALIALLAVNGLVTRWITDRYLEQGQDWMEDRLSQVQGILTQWEPASDTWDDLDEQPRALECGLPVAVRGHEIYSSLDPGQTELLRRMVSTGWMEDVATSVRSDGVMMVGVEKDPYTIIAMPQPEFPEIMGGHRPQSEATMLGLTASGLDPLRHAVCHLLRISGAAPVDDSDLAHIMVPSFQKIWCGIKQLR